MKKFYSLILCVGICYSSFSQQLTPTFTPGSGSFKLDWQHAGFPGDTVPSYPDVVNITAFGANNTGATSTNTAFRKCSYQSWYFKRRNLFPAGQLFVYSDSFSSRRSNFKGRRLREYNPYI